MNKSAKDRRVLMRGGKSPLERFTYEQALSRNLLGTNSGNLIFADAVFKTLYTGNTEIVTNGYSAKPKDAESINGNYDLFALPFANAFRKSFLPILDRFTLLIDQLNIPTVVMGIGVQSKLADTKFDELKFMNASVKAFCKTVLRRSASIGVRGEITYSYLRSLGFGDHEIDIIGCPSMFYFGPVFPETQKTTSLSQDDPLSINLSPYVKGIRQLFRTNADYYTNMDYITQNNESLDQILWLGQSLSKTGKVFPKSAEHSLFKLDKVRHFIDTSTWLKHLEKRKFVFGTRIHGNIAGLLAGTPSFLLVHDSRTLELAEYFHIPHVKFGGYEESLLAEDLLSMADYTKLHNAHPDNFRRWIAFLEKNDIDHVHTSKNDSGQAFDTCLQETKLSPSISTFQHQPNEVIFQRLIEKGFEDSQRIKDLTKKVKALESQSKKDQAEISRKIKQLNEKKFSYYLKRIIQKIRHKRR